MIGRDTNIAQKTPDFATVKGEVMKFFEKLVESKERTLLLRELIKEEVGLNKMENFLASHVIFCVVWGRGETRG